MQKINVNSGYTWVFRFKAAKERRIRLLWIRIVVWRGNPKLQNVGFFWWVKGRGIKGSGFRGLEHGLDRRVWWIRVWIQGFGVIFYASTQRFRDIIGLRLSSTAINIFPCLIRMVSCQN